MVSGGPDEDFAGKVKGSLRAIVEELTRRRKALGLRQVALAKMLGITQSTVSDFEKGSAEPRMSTLIKYAHAVDIQLSILMVAESVSPEAGEIGETLLDEPRPVVVSQCPSCKELAARTVYDIGSGPEVSCTMCEWCWGLNGQSLDPDDTKLDIQIDSKFGPLAPADPEPPQAA